MDDPLTEAVQELRDEVMFLREYIEYLVHELPLPWVTMLVYVSKTERTNLSMIWRQRYMEALMIAHQQEGRGKKPRRPLTQMPTLWSNPGRRRSL